FADGSHLFVGGAGDDFYEPSAVAATHVVAARGGAGDDTLFGGDANDQSRPDSGKPVSAAPAPATPPAATVSSPATLLTVSGYIINRERIEISPRFQGMVQWIGVKKGDE
ncbi:MAG TPA: hypothetical protein PKJ56_03445, partial [Promineifilum sp.]|nr:hypothetical protein [Promineifilum sp.]